MLAAEPLAIYTYHRLLDEWPLWRDLALPAAPGWTASRTIPCCAWQAADAPVYSPGHGSSTDALYRAA